MTHDVTLAAILSDYESAVPSGAVLPTEALPALLLQFREEYMTRDITDAEWNNIERLVRAQGSSAGRPGLAVALFSMLAYATGTRDTAPKHRSKVQIDAMVNRLIQYSKHCNRSLMDAHLLVEHEATKLAELSNANFSKVFKRDVINSFRDMIIERDSGLSEEVRCPPRRSSV